jgi:hypothetical protein
VKLIGCGDSWAWGAELTIVKSVPDSEMCPHSDHFIPENMDYRLSKRYLKLFADKIGADELVDLSLAAYSNDGIFRTLIRYLAMEGYMSGRDTSDLFVSIGWTSPERKEHACVDIDQFHGIAPPELALFKNNQAERWFSVGPWVTSIDYENKEINNFFKYYVKYFWTDLELTYRWISIIKNTENLLKRYNIKYVMHQAFFHYQTFRVNAWNDEKYKKEIIDNWTVFEQEIFKTIDSKHFVDKDDFLKTFHHTVLDKVNGDTEKIFTIFHPNAYAHELWAEHQYQFCLKNNLLT